MPTPEQVPDLLYSPQPGATQGQVPYQFSILNSDGTVPTIQNNNPTIATANGAVQAEHDSAGNPVFSGVISAAGGAAGPYTIDFLVDGESIKTYSGNVKEESQETAGPSTFGNVSLPVNPGS